MAEHLKLDFELVDRPERHYAAILLNVEQKAIPVVLPPACDEVIKKLAENNIQPSGPPFFRYLKMRQTMIEVEVGVLINKRPVSIGNIKSGSFPQGTYATASYKGPYQNLIQVHMGLEKWGSENRINFSGSRTEFYHTDESKEPNPENWLTVVEFETGVGENKLK